MYLPEDFMLFLLCWMLLLVLSTVATIIAAIMAICLKDKARERAIDALLIVATIGYLVFQGANFLPKTAQNMDAQASVQLDATRQADIIAMSLRSAAYVARLGQPWSTIAAIEGFTSYADAAKKAETALDKLSAAHPDDAKLAARIASLRANELVKPNMDDDARFRSWEARSIGLNAFELLMTVLGITSLVYFVRRNTQSWLPSPVNYGFRKTYGCLLAMLCGQAVAALLSGVAAGFIAGFTAALHHTKTHMPNFSQELLLAAMLGGLITGLLSAWLFICRPAKTGFIATFWTDNLSVKQLLLYGFGGMFAMSAMTSVIQLIMTFAHVSPQTANEVSQQWIDAVLSNNGAKFMWCGLLVCISAPIVEELLFRGLLYSWLRQRCGVILGIIGSSLMFALVHVDFQRFIYYVGLGAVLAIVYERTRSLRVTTMMHALWNLWALLTMAMLVP
jgi:membrane protease YdiL (CAAX protease family)